jgi:hypothetical protein
MPITCYTQRLLNPFRGVINCIRYESAEAVTRDGLRWDIYVSNDRLLDGMDTGRRVQISDIRYGSWSPETGLKRGPLYPSDDFRYLEHMGAIVYEHLLEVHDRIPFPLTDRFELWLLDREARPLALLDSAVRREDMELDQSAEWRAGQACRQTFTSTVADRLAPEPGREGAAAAYLSRHINACAGPSPAAQWFERLPDGSGAGLAGIDLEDALVGRALGAGNFLPCCSPRPLRMPCTGSSTATFCAGRPPGCWRSRCWTGKRGNAWTPRPAPVRCWSRSSTACTRRSST